MLRLDDVLQVHDGEEVRVITRRHAITLIPSLVLALLLIVAPFFFLFPLFASGPVGIVVFAIVVFVGVAIAFRAFIIWDGNALIATTERVVEVQQEGVFARTVNEIIYDNVQDISWTKRSPLDMTFNIGIVRIRTVSGGYTIEDPYLPKPQKLQQIINDLYQGVQPKRTDVTPERADLLKKVSERLETLDDKSLDKIIGTLRKDDRDIAIKKLFGDGAGKKGLKPLEDGEPQQEEREK